jgi:hypothetical protein
MFTVKYALEEELKQPLKDDSLEYHQRQANLPRAKQRNLYFN